MCNCIEENQGDVHILPFLKEGDEAKSFQLKGVGYRSDGSEPFTYSELIVGYVSNSLPAGFRNKEKCIFIPHTFCPFCGEKY